MKMSYLRNMSCVEATRISCSSCSAVDSIRICLVEHSWQECLDPSNAACMCWYVLVRAVRVDMYIHAHMEIVDLSTSIYDRYLYIYIYILSPCRYRYIPRQMDDKTYNDIHHKHIDALLFVIIYIFVLFSVTECHVRSCPIGFEKTTNGWRKGCAHWACTCPSRRTDSDGLRSSAALGK